MPAAEKVHVQMRDRLLPELSAVDYGSIPVSGYAVSGGEFGGNDKKSPDGFGIRCDQVVR